MPIKRLIKFFRIKRIRAKVGPRKNRKNYLTNKEKARALVHERLEFYNRFYGFGYNRVSIKNTRSRWGSCSKKGNLNFNYKIALLPPRLADYIIVHELCHLGEFNHSHKFWDLVAQVVPDHKSRRKELKKIMSTLAVAKLGAEK